MNAATAILPEFLHIFGEDGPVTIEVYGPNGALPLPPRNICAEDIAWLVSTDGQKLRASMSFGGEERTIRQCTLDMAAQRIRLDVS